ncbi:MAG TPA: M28 family peptidase [Longimicrobium sp.]|jgi:Zn-dependent M28 family amino/carboxypeptidase
MEAVSAERLEGHVRMLAGELAPRSVSHPANLDAAASYVAARMAEGGAEVADQRYRAHGQTFRNVVARLGPREGERVVVGAHYDAAGPFPGADDNASGVAGVIELARVLAGAPLAVPVELVAYPCEEPPFFRTPFMGSMVHAASLRDEGVRVRAMIALEMIGFFSDAPGSQSFPSPLLKPFYPSRGNFITVVGRLGQGPLIRRVKRAMRRASPLTVRSIQAPQAVPGVDFSDHASYWAAGFDAVMVTDTAFYRNPHYHTAHDTPDTLDYRRMAMVVEGVRAAVLALAT